MDSKHIEEYKKQLEKKRQELLGELEKDETPEDFGSDVDDFDEEKNETEAFDNQLAAGQGLKGQIVEVDSAIEKIKAGKYGICEKCSGEIEKEVLAASPESRLCKNCKKAFGR
ncbi:MAG TPA: TraR/DksA family transcriptional regulator [Candidatus Paceibacterota bacterium]|nr:TraR/DksA family transcriptional regulator [Candidatus Paceibacterota bacterium]